MNFNQDTTAFTLVFGSCAVMFLLGCAIDAKAATLNRNVDRGFKGYSQQVVQLPENPKNIDILNHGAKYPKETTTVSQNSDGSIDLK
jgi:hypothetical protein